VLAARVLRTLLGALRNGRALRHAPITAPNEPAVRLVIRSRDAPPVDVSRDHVPVSLRPLVLGVRLDAAADGRELAGPAVLAFQSVADGRELGSMRVRASGSIPLAQGTLRLLTPVRTSNRCEPAPSRWVRYALAWQHARRAPARGDRLCMGAADLRALNLYYASARRVYLVGVAHQGRTNLFPMDLVAHLAPCDFVLALRATSPAIELMERSRRLALSAAPAGQVQAVHALGAHHRREHIDLEQVPFPVVASPRFGLPSVEGRLAYELAVRDVHRVGSHVVFVTTPETAAPPFADQLAHVSAMFARWQAKRAR
jgi:flavin reductase (DIM6/NTAB) family NADH-FMN oxidoreductase RutF